MRIIPVLDIKDGLVVHGRGGQRGEYKPLRSTLVDSCDPIRVACALRDQYGAETLYLADLDAIVGKPRTLLTYASLASRGFRLMVDAGIRDLTDIAAVVDSGVEIAIIGLESLPRQQLLDEAVLQYGPDRLCFSLDLMNGAALGMAWEGAELMEIVNEVIRSGIARLIVLDLADVGREHGTTTTELCARIRRLYPEVYLIAGGGVRGDDDLPRLSQAGVNGALVATALHQRKLQAWRKR